MSLKSPKPSQTTPQAASVAEKAAVPPPAPAAASMDTADQGPLLPRVETSYPVGQTPLFHHYHGQNKPQDAYLEILPETGFASLDWNGVIGNAVPMMLYHNRMIRVSVPNTLSAEECQDFLDEIQPLLVRIRDGYEENWDGNNTVGRLSKDAENALREIEGITDGLDGPIPISVWEVDDYLRDRSLCELVNEGEALGDAASRLTGEARTEGVVLDGDVEDYLQKRLTDEWIERLGNSDAEPDLLNDLLHNLDDIEEINNGGFYTQVPALISALGLKDAHDRIEQTVRENGFPEFRLPNN